MNQRAKVALGTVGSLAALAVVCVVLVKLDIQCLPAQFYPPDMPGELSNPKLVAMFNEQIDGLERGDLDASRFPGVLPEAGANARQWLGEVREIVVRCRYGASYKFNWFMYDLTLASGEVVANQIASTDRCSDDYQTAMRVTFEAGRAVDVKTDGSELARPPDQARGTLALALSAAIGHDKDARPARYYKRNPPPPPPAEQWGKL